MASNLILRPSRGLNLSNEKSIFEQNADEEKADKLIKSIVGLLERGEKEIKLVDQHKDVILILGNTGSGKSTFTQWVAGDNSKMISKETKEGTGEYIIEDHNRIGDTTLKSKTIFPELVIDAKTNAAYYDCPGFSDTQGTGHDIATTYFIKKVVDYSEKVKMVFTISHPSLRKGVDRQDFMKLLRHVTDFLKDIEKFKHSIALVATKVDNQYVKQGRNFVLVADDRVIAAIADFLQEAKQYLKDSSNRSKTNDRFYENAIKFIDILLEKDGEHYTKIGLFRRPDEPGPVSAIALLQKGKQNIERVVYEKLNFTAKNNQDFGYTVSEKTKNDISELVSEINKNLWSSLSNIAERIQKYYENLVEQVRCKIRLFVSETDATDVSTSEARAFRDKFSYGYHFTSDLVTKTKNLTNPEELALLVNSTASNLDIDVPKDDILYIENQGKYFSFLQTVSDKILSSKPWDLLFKDVQTFFSSSKTIILHDVDFAAEKINRRIQINLNDTVKAIQETYVEKIKLLEIQKLPEMLNRDSRIILKLTEGIMNGTTTEKLVNSIAYVANNLEVSLPKENLQNISNQGKYLQFLEVVSGGTVSVESMAILSPFKNMAKYFSELERWYIFLEDLYSKLSEYAIQKDRQKYNVADLEDWGQANKPQGISVTSNTFEKFLNKIENYNVKEFESLKNMTATGFLIDDLNQVLSLTLKHRSIIRCSKPYIIVKGTFIGLNETMQNIISNADTNNSCSEFQVEFASSKYNMLKVFALNKVFIDADLSFESKGTSMAVIAPKWEILGSRSIKLNGADGVPHAESKAKSGVYPIKNGANGSPGNPGGSGETFFGMGDTFVDGANLKITSNGGKGGFGQDGGDGVAGDPGRDGMTPNDWDPPCENGYVRGFKCEVIKQKDRGTLFPFLVVMNTHWSCTVKLFTIFGVPCSRGGDGGNGGNGGKGGDPGSIIILELNQPSEIEKLTAKGEEGKMGKGGSGGLGGKNGDDVRAGWSHCKPDGLWYLFGEREYSKWKWEKTIKNDGVCPPGTNGKNGGNGNPQDPKLANGIPTLHNIINEYKIYLRENLNNRFKRHSTLQFLEKLSSKNDVRKIYDVLGLIDEFRGLENQFNKLSDQINFSPFYNSLLERISDFANSHKDGPDENKKVLSYLYTAILGRIYNLKDDAEPVLIIHIREYLNLVKENIKTLEDLQTMNNKVEVINKYKENYKKDIDKKIEEAKSFIKKQISPEIENINAEIDDHVNSLIEEIFAMQKQAEKERWELAEKNEELENALAAKGVFNCLRIIGGIVSFLGPFGAIAGTVIEATSTVGESLALSNQKQTLNLPSNVVSDIKSLGDQIKILRNRKVVDLNKLLDNVLEEIKKNPEKLSDMTGKITNIKNELKKASENKLDFTKVKALENELLFELRKKGDDLKFHSKDEKRADAEKILGKITQIAKFGSMLLNLYDRMKEDKVKVGAITEAMERIGDKIKKLKEYEENIYDTMVPMLQEMEENLKDTSEKLGSKSHVALDVTKWQVQSFLKDMKLQMQQFTKRFEVNADLSRSIEKLDDAITTLINIYDRIQSYQYKQNEINYIADISSVAASSINITNHQLQDAVNHLEFVIRANIVLNQYKSAIGAFKQWVFPFADHYIEKSMLPSQLELNSSLQDLVRSAAREIETIKRKMDLYKVGVQMGDEYLMTDEFSSRFISTKPFFVWKNEVYGSLIANLLSGKDVILKADVEKSVPRRDAIKVSLIDFQFKTKNDTVQSLLSEILKGFDLRATHLGNSYYRYADKISSITSNSVTVVFSLEKYNSTVPLRSNQVFKDLQAGDLVLSPYTSWELRLTNATNHYSYHHLESYKNGIDLELSGFGSYIDMNAFERTPYKSFIQRSGTNMSDLESNATDTSECTRSKRRLARSPNDIAADGDYMTNGAAVVAPSPINFFFNFLKTYFVSNIIISTERLIVRKQRIIKNYVKISHLPDELREAAFSDQALTLHPTIMEVEAKSAVDDLNGEGGEIALKSENIFSATFDDGIRHSRSSLISVQRDRGSLRLVQIPDLNSSLLLADLVARTITGNKYNSSVDECLFSPKEVVYGKIRNVVVKSERDIRQNLQRLLSEKEMGSSSRSWFSKFNGYAKSILQILGIIGNDETEKYAQDIRNLFA